jgi:hypothetical protein
MNAPEIVWALTCPECGEAVWDLPRGSKLAKCWNSEAHESGGPLAFDTKEGIMRYEIVLVFDTEDIEDGAEAVTREEIDRYAEEVNLETARAMGGYQGWRVEQYIPA